MPRAAMRRRVLIIAGVALALTPASRVPAQQPTPTIARDDARFSFYDRGPYRPGIPRPESLLGYPIGEQNTQYAAQERTLLAIADAAKDRVRVEEFTSTNERRTMRLYIVSSPENIARLDAIRRDLDRIADPRGGSPAELDTLAARVPAVVWIYGSVHGNESPGFETCMQMLYQLAASEEPATLAALRNTIVIINPSTNPDGHERFTVWYNSVSVAAADPRAMEHIEPWSVQGRYNHYRFDMNRDVMASTQREVQGTMRMMLKWHPMVAVDLHGHVSTYFFPPAARPVNANIVGDPGKWMELFGRANAAAFDRYGWMYYSRDVFDFYDPGYWDAWPSLNGAIGMTFETDGGGHRGVLWRRADGTLLSLRDGVAKHFVAALATIEATSSRAPERVRDYLAFRRRAVADGRSGAIRRVIIAPARDPGRTAELVSALLRAGIEVRRAERSRSPQRARTRTPTMPSRRAASTRARTSSTSPSRRERSPRRSSSRPTSSTRRSRRRRSPSSSAIIGAAAAPKPRSTSSTTSPPGRSPSPSASTRTGPTIQAPCPASCSPFPPRNPRCHRRSSSRVPSGASFSR